MKDQTGSTLTRTARQHSLQHLHDALRASGRPASIGRISAKHIEWYIASQLDSGLSRRTLQNRMSHIRCELRAIGRHKLAGSPRLSCKALGINGASRNGTHRALSPEHYRQALEQARTIDAGFAAALQLQRELGLRAREAVMCPPSLNAWQHAIERLARCRVTRGTKGGRPRDTASASDRRALKAIHEARQIVKRNGGQLIVSRSLRGAMRRYHRLCKQVGLTGQYASHALRCTYARDKYGQYLLDTGGDRREALAAVSLELGHGDGRGTYVAQVYIRNGPGAAI